MSAPKRRSPAQPSFVRELSIALEHRWNHEAVFVIFTAYFDESDSHGGCDALTMAAMVGSGREWELFGRRLGRLQKEHDFKIFHSTEFRHRYKRAAPDKTRQLRSILEGIGEAAQSELTEAVSVTIPRELYLSEYRNKPFPRKMRVDSHWGVCFGFCLRHIVGTVIESKGKHRLHVVVEDGHANRGAAVEITKEIKGQLLRQGIDLIGTVTYAGKDDCPPLMAADLVAHTFKLSHDREQVGRPGFFDLAGTLPKKVHGGQSHISVEPENLHALKQVFEIEQKERHEDYLTRKAAFVASKLSEQNQ